MDAGTARFSTIDGCIAPVKRQQGMRQAVACARARVSRPPDDHCAFSLKVCADRVRRVAPSGRTHAIRAAV
jgi:hypothetical protein